MTPERYSALMNDDNTELTPEEIHRGWHFCPDWDSLLIGPGMLEMRCCTCEVFAKQPSNQPATQTIK